MVALLDGSRIAKLRKQKGWEQRQLASIAQVDPSVISRLERGIQEDFKLSIVISVASALEVSVDALLSTSLLPKSGQLVAELQSVFKEVGELPIPIQRQIAGMIRGFLSALRDE